MFCVFASIKQNKKVVFFILIIMIRFIPNKLSSHYLYNRNIKLGMR